MQGGYEGKRAEVETLTDLLNKSEIQFLSPTDVKAEALPYPSEKWEAPFNAVKKNAVAMVRAIKE